MPIPQKNDKRGAKSSILKPAFNPVKFKKGILNRLLFQKFNS